MFSFRGFPFSLLTSPLTGTVPISDPALLALAEDQIGRPLRPRMIQGLGARGRVEDTVEGIQAGMDRLRAEHALEAAANDEHGGAVHQRPYRQHEPRVLAGIAAQTFGHALAHEIESRPGLMQRRGLTYAVKKHFVGVLVFEREIQLTQESLAEGMGPA